jgi:hypothetical protein
MIASRLAMHLSARSNRTRALLCVLAFAVWVATTLGLVHGTIHNALTHARDARPALLAPAAGAAPTAASAPAPLHQWLSALFDHHTDADCRLYDQLSHGSAPLCVPPVILPVVLPAATFAYLEGEVLARWVALFDARGPPSTR